MPPEDYFGLAAAASHDQRINQAAGDCDPAAHGSGPAFFHPGEKRYEGGKQDGDSQLQSDDAKDRPGDTCCRITHLPTFLTEL